MKNIARIKQEIQQAIKKYFKNDKDTLEYVYVDDGKSRYGNPYIEVRAELGYNSMTKLADHLDKIVQKYDKEAYFEQVEPGIMQVYFNGISESRILSERLDSHLQNIKEESDIEAQIDQKCKKLGFTKLKSLFGDQEYIYTGNYNHSIFYYPKKGEISYKIKEKTPGRMNSYYDYKEFWKINNNLDHIFKEISKEFEGHE